ncbi:MAG TPA: glutathione S-transferase family protein [Rhizomicrobium sp.]|nr:glutathione S-transferase family protein [Rhizomicrobium sp.]
MIKFFGFGPAFGLPDPSPFVMKSEVQLKMAGVPYTFERAAPPAAPKGKIPYIQVGAHRLGDSTFIRSHIEKEHSFDFDKGFCTVERSIAWSFERMLEDHLYFAIIHMRWMDDENWQKGPIHFFDGAPDGVAEASRQRVREMLHGQGMGRHTTEEIAMLGDRSLSALSAFLGDKLYLMGETPCGADATAFGFIASVLTPFFTGDLRKRAERHSNLVAYRDRMMLQYYPDFEQKQAA